MKVALLAVLLAVPLFVAPAVGDVYVGAPPDRVYNLVMSGTTFNLRPWPGTPLLEAYVGEAVQITVAIPATAEPHTFHLHGHPWFSPTSATLPCADLVSLSGPLSSLTPPCDGKVIDTILLRPGDVHSFTVIAGGLDLQPGDWMYHCHIEDHMAAGMWGIFRVYPASAQATRAPNGALDLHLSRLGTPVDATFDPGVHAVRLDAGHYLVHGAGDSLVAHTTVGDTVWRAPGAAPESLTTGAVGGHVHG